MLRALCILLVFQLAGEVLARWLALPIAGPVVGMLLLLLLLLWRGAVPPFLRQTGEGLLTYLPLLFVPAGVGILVHLPTLQGEWLALALTLVVSTLITVVATALLLRLFIWLAALAGTPQHTAREE